MGRIFEVVGLELQTGTSGSLLQLPCKEKGQQEHPELASQLALEAVGVGELATGLGEDTGWAFWTGTYQRGGRRGPSW